MGRIYATTTDLVTYTGSAAPAGADNLLQRASRLLDADLFRLYVYDVDTTTGLPTDPDVAATMRDAVCAQVDWWDELGDSKGALGAGWDDVQIGSVKLQRRSPTAVGASASAAREIAPEVGDVLLSAELSPHVFRRGVACW
jgi:hypothetical protein